MKSNKKKNSEKTYKIVLLGEGRVGKTSIITRYLENKFSEHTNETVCGYCNEKNVNTKYGEVNLVIWDTAGQEKYHALGRMYYKNADAAILVYDITLKETLNKTLEWIQELKQFSENENLMIILVGNKCDMHAHRDIEQSEIDSISKKYLAKDFQVSAKSGKGIEEIFNYLAQELANTKKTQQNRISLERDAKMQKEQGTGCC